jgi:molybdopterin converting factor small subunit
VAEVRIPTVLRPSTGGNSTIDAEGETVGEILRSIGTKFPEFLPQVVNEDGTMHRFVNIYLNDDDIRYLDKLETKVSPSDKLAILPAVAGGSL